MPTSIAVALYRFPSFMRLGNRLRQRSHSGADVVEPRHLGARFGARDDTVGYLFALSGVQFLPSPADTALGPSGGKTGGGPLTDHGAFEFSGMRCTAYGRV